MANVGAVRAGLTPPQHSMLGTADSGILQQQTQQPLWKGSAADLLLPQPASGETSQKSLDLATSDPLDAGPTDVSAAAAAAQLGSMEAGGTSRVEQPQRSASPAGPEGRIPSSAGSAAPRAPLPQPNSKVEGTIPGPSAAPAVPAAPSGIQEQEREGPEPLQSCHGEAPALPNALPTLPTAPAAAGPAAAAAAPAAAAPPSLEGFAGSSVSLALEQHLASLLGPPPSRSEGWPLQLQVLPQVQHPAPAPAAKPPQKRQRQKGGAQEAAQVARRSLPLGQWEGLPHAGQVWEGMPLEQGQRLGQQQQQQPQQRQQHSSHPMPAPPFVFGISGAGKHLLPHGLLSGGSELDKLMNSGHSSSRPQSRQDEQKGGPFAGAVLATSAQQQTQPAMPQQPNPWFGAGEGALEPGKAQQPSLWAAASGLAHSTAQQHRGQQQQQQDAAAAMFSLAQQMGLGGNPPFFNPVVPPPHLLLGGNAPQAAYPRPLPLPALQQLLSQPLQAQAPLPGLELWGGAPWLGAPAAPAPNQQEQQPPRQEVQPPRQRQQQQEEEEEVEVEDRKRGEDEQEEEEEAEEDEEDRGAYPDQQAQHGLADGAGEGCIWEGSAPEQSPLVTEDAILAASALKALQGAALPGPNALLSPAGQEGPPILLSMLQQGGGAGAAAHSRRKSAPHKLPWAGELVEARPGGGGSHIGPKHNSRPPSRGPRGASLDGDWVPTASSAGGRGGRGRGRGGAGRGNGRGGRGGAAQPESGRSTPLGDGVRPAVAAALEMMANMRGSRRSFAVDQTGTFVKAILSRELEGCKYIKIPDVYREMLVGDSTEAIFLHRASGKEWQLSVTPLKLKWWMPEFGLQVGDELVLRSALDDPAQLHRTHAPDSTPIVLVEVWRDGEPLPAAAPQQPATLPLRNGGGTAGSKRERGSGEGSHAGSYGAAGGSLEGTGDEMEDEGDGGDEEYEWGWHRPARRPRSYGGGGGSRANGGPAGKDGVQEKERVELENGRQEAARPAANSAWATANLLLQRYAAGAAQQSAAPAPQAAQQQQQPGAAALAPAAAAGPGVKHEAQQAQQQEQSYITQVTDSSIPVALRFMFAAAGHKHVEVRVLPKGEEDSKQRGPGASPQRQQQAHPQQAQQAQQPPQEQLDQIAQVQESQPREAVPGSTTAAPARASVSTAAAAATVAAAAAALAAEQGQPYGEAARSTGSQPATRAEAGPEVGAGMANSQQGQQQQGADIASNKGQQRLLKYSMLADLMGILVASGVDAGLQEAFSRAFLDTFDDAMRSAVYSGVREASALSDSERVLEWVQVALEDL